MNITYCQTTIDEIYELRFEVLRPKQVPIKLHFDGDGDVPPRTWHFGAFLNESDAKGRIVACLTIFATTWEGKPALQLRGMAVAEDFRGKGVGQKLLVMAQQEVGKNPAVTGQIWWCNARTRAIGFYERNGWRTVSEEFVIEHVGPHKKMVREAKPGA